MTPRPHEMRILVVNYEYPPIGGGGGFVTRDILESMAEQGHEVTIITSAYGKLPRREHKNGVTIYRVPVLLRNKLETASLPSMLSYVPSAFMKAVFGMRDKRFDIINTHFAIPSGPAGHAIAKKLNLPNILSIHGGDIYDPSKPLSPHRVKLLSATVSFILNKADRVVAQSTDTKNNALRYFKTQRDIDVIPLGIKKPIFPKKTRSELGLDENAVILCAIGRLVKRKNFSKAIEIVSTLSQPNTKIQFVIIGDGPKREELEALARRHAANRTIFMGNVPDTVKFQILSASDIYVSTAMHEGFGVVFLEAMECGLPIISYDHGGQKDFLKSGRTGYLVPAGDESSYKEALLKLIQSPSLRHEMGEFNKRLIPDFYIDRCARAYLNLFDQVLAK